MNPHSSDQIQIWIFEIHNLSVFLEKDLKKFFFVKRFFEKKKGTQSTDAVHI